MFGILAQLIIGVSIGTGLKLTIENLSQCESLSFNQNEIINNIKLAENKSAILLKDIKFDKNEISNNNWY